ncbi:MAG: hypothetical protein FJZ87_13225 [Chloroflexi bacterium]|nr:hypothetical protein [Chloroflexota bacterium]
MDRKIFHGYITPEDVGHALVGEFHRGNLRAQMIGSRGRIIVQIGSHPGAMSGGQTAITVTTEKLEDGILVQMGQQAWLGVAASLGISALSAIRNPFSLLGRLDDIAQDLEYLQLSERIWKVIERTVQTAGASRELSDRLRRLECDYCGTANKVGDAACMACGAPLGGAQPKTCSNCGYVVSHDTLICPNCNQNIG